MARELVARETSCHLVDVEHLGALIRQLLPKELLGPDYQHDPLWTELNIDVLSNIDGRYAGVLVVPMTLWEVPAFETIIGGWRAKGVAVRHATLLAPIEVLHRRIGSGAVDDPAATQWRLEMAERCLASLSDSRFAVHLDCSNGVENVLNALLTRVHLVESRT